MSERESRDQWFKELLLLSGEKVTEKQTRILYAAAEIFAEKGYAYSSTSEIAQRAGVAEGTIFRHYKTKQDLLSAIVSPVMSKLLAPFVLNDFKEILESDYPKLEDFLYALAVNRLNFVKKNSKILKILLQEIPFQPMLQEEFKQHVGYKVFHRFIEIIEHFKSKGEVIDLPSFSIFRFIGSSLIGLFVTRFLFSEGQPWDEEKEIRDVVQLILNGIKT
ncbi:TetR/AcrR family transcriptional regulator [Paenibacillus brevis]|uniref:TetR/AcrR family transcriptional regulator n=1 Tax=Paenibacillus brevis TaxID=2841508 RepID=A0ABS6FYF6_9BACL|nr:TetR/AcrR family transcriptional regulator [Paenibacillus brevis]MBU5674522.1 TetR/AcrR family transcriptional regulator [Paenibacillus brevis]